MTVLKKIGVGSFAKVYAWLGGIAGIVLAAFVFVSVLFGMGVFNVGGGGAGIGIITAILSIPVTIAVAAILGYVFGWIGATFYNMAAANFGGVSFTLKSGKISELQSIDWKSFAVVSGAVFAGIGFIVGLVILIASLFVSVLGGLAVGVVILIAGTIGGAIAGLISGALGAVFYNLAAGWIGGITFNLDSKGGKGGPSVVSFVFALQAGKVYGIVGALSGALRGILLFIFTFNILGLISSIIIEAIASFVGVIVGIALYNFVAHRTGGYEFYLE